MKLRLDHTLMIAIFAMACFNCSKPFNKEKVRLSEEPVNPAVIYKTMDNGRTWSSFANGIPKSATVSGFETDQNRIYASTDYHGVFVTENGENQWRSINQGLPTVVDINCIVADGEKLVIGTLKQGIFISNDQGKSWQIPGSNIKNTSIRAFIELEDKLLAGTDNGIYESNDMGNSWKPAFGRMQVLGFTALHGKVYAAVFNGAIMTSDNGLNWQYIYESDALHDISNDGEYVYAMTLGQGLLKSKNDGKTWEVVISGLGSLNYYTNELKYIGADLFSAQWLGVYHSMNHGNQWTKLGGLPDSTAFSTLEVTDYGLITGIALRD